MGALWKQHLYKKQMKIKFIIGLSLLLLLGCTRSNPIHINSVDSKKILDPAIDSSSITGLYKFIFSPKCSVSGCHDGTFEPNFTTIQSSYSTLVYHPINKNNKAKTYKYRVLPYDTGHSVLYARVSQSCFVNPGDQMPQLDEKDKLSNNQIQCVGKWIINGAKNIDEKTIELKDTLQ